MGDRGEVEIISDGGSIHLYTHYDATELPEIVQKALIRGVDAIDDPEYLARIIFCEMIRGDVLGTEGYGIGVDQTDAWRIVRVTPDGVRSSEGGLVEIIDNGVTWLTMDIRSFLAQPKGLIYPGGNN